MFRFLVLSICCGLLVGCSGPDVAKRLPDDPEQLIVYSIDGPSWMKNAGLTEEQQKGEILYAYPVLGKVEIADPEQRRAVIAAIKEATSREPARPPAACFVPRHAIRIVKAGETLEMLLCFECGSYEGYRDGKRHLGRSNRLAPDAEAAPLLDKVLTEAGVRLAAKEPTPESKE